MIYLHVPFCRSFCTYCAFYSEICPESYDLTGYRDAVISEIERRKEEFSKDFNTLYIGGGTPSVLPLCVLGDIVGKLRDVLGMDPRGEFLEFTVEVNPDDIVSKGIDYVKALRDLGVNRVSMGVQSFDDGILRWMNRRHNGAEAVRAVRLLREGGIGNISIDLIFGFPGLSEKLWDETVEKALELAPDHISAYQLSVEEGSALWDMAAAGRFNEASEEVCSSQYYSLCQRLEAAGYHHYEISNFALPGREARHNSAYWRHVPYVGLGPAAHSFDGRTRKWNVSDVNEYLAGADMGCEALGEEELALEKLMLGLRTDSGVPLSFAESKCDRKSLRECLEKGFLEKSGENIRISPDHLFVADSIILSLS